MSPEPDQERSSACGVGLTALSEVPLLPHNREVLDRCQRDCQGPEAWRRRKLADARDVLALSQIAPRLAVIHLDLGHSIRLLADLRVTVPCMPRPEGELFIARRALLGVTYGQEALTTPQSGLSFVEILQPPRVWHANVLPKPGQPLCLGPRLPAGIPLVEVILMTYGALTMQTWMLDPEDSAGLANPAAARWWLANRERLIPLSTEPFILRGDGTRSTAQDEGVRQ